MRKIKKIILYLFSIFITGNIFIYLFYCKNFNKLLNINDYIRYSAIIFNSEIFHSHEGGANYAFDIIKKSILNPVKEITFSINNELIKIPLPENTILLNHNTYISVSDSKIFEFYCQNILSKYEWVHYDRLGSLTILKKNNHNLKIEEHKYLTTEIIELKFYIEIQT